MDVLTTIEAEMKLGAVLNFKSLDSQIGAHEESYGLQHKIQINALSLTMASSTQKKVLLCLSLTTGLSQAPVFVVLFLPCYID
jgi:hypothetical protein